MEPFIRLDATAVPIGLPNVDTDQIIPARFLWRKRRDGFGHLLFHDLRFDDAGAPKPDFVLNRDAYQDARIIVADRNFGCGSSREHAVWALSDYGIRAVVAPSFGDIFLNNSFQNGLLPVVLPAKRVAELRALLEQSPGSRVGIDLEAQTVRGSDGVLDRFAIDPFRKECLLAGTDDISFTLGHRDRIAEFEKVYEARIRWLYSSTIVHPTPSDGVAPTHRGGRAGARASRPRTRTLGTARRCTETECGRATFLV